MKNNIKYFFACLLVLMCLQTNAQENILDEKYNFSRIKGTVYQLLSGITEQTGYQFIYNSEIINNNKQTVLPKGEYTIPAAIHKITGNHNLLLKPINNHILIYEAKESSLADTTHYGNFTIEGTIRDNESNKTITYASVNVGSIGVVTNMDGYYKLIIPDSLHNSKLTISHIGYKSREIDASVLAGNNITIFLEPQVLTLPQVLVETKDPVAIVKKMLEYTGKNYSAKPVYLTSFYREGSNFEKDNVNLTESVLMIYKTGIKDHLNYQAKLLKMRTIENKTRQNLIVTKLKGGIHSSLLLDIVIYKPDFLEFSNNYYNYYFTGIINYDNQWVNVINFKQKENVTAPLYTGKLYINTDNYALVHASFEINPKYAKKATSIFIIQKDRRLKIALKQASYTVTYKQVDNMYYINHIRSDLVFNSRNKNSFKTAELHSWAEMVTCKVDATDVKGFARKERIPIHTIFSDTKFEYDNTFWGNFNVIMPENKLRESVLNNLRQGSEVFVEDYDN